VRCTIHAVNLTASWAGDAHAVGISLILLYFDTGCTDHHERRRDDILEESYKSAARAYPSVGG